MEHTPPSKLLIVQLSKEQGLTKMMSVAVMSMIKGVTLVATVARVC